MNKVYIVGVGMTRFGKFIDRSVKDLTREAVEAALTDAGLPPGQVNRAYFANVTQAAIEGQFAIPGQIALHAMGFERLPIVNVENACASGSSALHLAYLNVASGQDDVVLAVGAEKMYSEDREKSFAVFNGGWDVHQVSENHARIKHLGADVTVPSDWETGEARSIFMDIYASLAKFHMKTFGTTQRQLAAVSSKNHAHSVHNALSQYRHAISIEEVLAARKVAWPLTMPMCAPISDGAAAVLLCNEAVARRLAHPARRIQVLASVLRSGSNRRAEEVDQHICHLAALDAYERAGVGPEDINVAEVHDASAFAEILQTEALGLCEFGAGGHLAESGATSLGGRIPVNPSGGLESKGHPIGATGLGQIFELVTQLRGEAGERQVAHARLAVAENGGGFYGIEEAAACITVLGKVHA